MKRILAGLRWQLISVVVGSVAIGCGMGLLLGSGIWVAGVPLLLIGAGLMTVGLVALYHTSIALETLAGTLTSARDATMLPLHNPLPPNTPLTPLGEDLIRLGQQIRRHIAQLQMQADYVREIAIRTGESAMQHSHSTLSQASAVREVAAAVSEFDTIVANVTELAHQVASAAEESLRATNQSSQTVDTVVTAITNSSQRAETMAAAMVQLRDQVGQIGNISNIIAEVAHDTHLLALNAAIEATSAGSAGLRFSVIAVEIRELAARTREGSEQVSRIVTELSEALLNTEAAARASLEQTSAATAMTTALSVTTSQLNSSAGNTQQLASAIDQAMAQQRTSSTQVSAAINNIATSVHTMSEQSEAMATRATSLTTVANQLRQSALRFGGSETSTTGLRLLIAGRETVSQRSLAWRALVDDWNRSHPTAIITLEFTPPGPDYIPNLQQEFAAGHAPDILQIPGHSDIEFTTAGRILPLDSLLSPSVADDFFPQALSYSAQGKHLYQLPTEAQPLVMFYNRRLLDELNLEPPQTWEQLIALGKRCRARGDWGLIMETDPGMFRMQHWLPFVWQNSSAALANKQTVLLDDPAVKTALRFWQELFGQSQCVPRNPPHPGYDIANLADGHCAMQYIGTWGMNMLQADYPEFDYGITDLPLPPGGQPANMLLTWGLAVNAKSTNQEAALEFVRWALAAEGDEGAARIHSLTVEGMPVRRSAALLAQQQATPDPHWLYVLEHIYPHSHISPIISVETLAAVDALLAQVIEP